MENLESVLKEHGFLSDFPDELLPVIVGCASNVRYDTEQFIFHESEEARKVYLIRQGKVAVEIFVPGRGHVVIETLEAGDVLGWSWLVPPYYWHFDARVVEPTRAIALDGECLRKKCEDNHEMGYQLLKRFFTVLSSRLQATRLQLMDVYGAKADW
ncbi:cyclic nucleotide-binding domain-containing protein [bacterium]|nr:MAG: cyclic nucleotide-binding domain-containing protein [bacterium]